MSMLAIDWDSAGITGVVSSGGDKVNDTFCIRWPENQSPRDNPQEAGQFLQAELARLGIREKEAVVTLRRDETVMRPLQLPDVADSELAGIVQLQAATKSTVPMDQLALDYIPLPPRDGLLGREVLMCTTGQATIRVMRSVLEAAGIELKSVGISSVSTAEFISRLRKRSGTFGTELIVLTTGERVELTVTKPGYVISSHAGHIQTDTHTPEAAAKQTVAEINRLRMSLSSEQNITSFSGAWLIGRPEFTSALQQALSSRLEDCQLTPVDPLKAVRAAKNAGEGITIDAYGALAPAIGALQANRSSTLGGVDFLNPRKPEVKKDRRGLYAAIAGAAALFLVVAGYMWVASKVASLDEQIALQKNNAESDRLEFRSKKSKATLDAARVIGEWRDHRVNWLDEMVRMNKDVFPGTDRVYVSKFTFDKKNGKTAGQIQAAGYGKTRKQIETVKIQARRNHYQVTPTPIEPASRGGYNHELILKMQVPTKPDLDAILAAEESAKKSDKKDKAS